jgi:hypothetical protein
MTTTFDFALDIFQKIVPIGQQPHIRLPNSVMGVDVTDAAANSYLQALDHHALADLNVIFQRAFQQIFQDNLVTISDIPAVLKLVKDVTECINEFNDRKDAIFEVSRLAVCAFLRITTVILIQMFIPQSASILDIVDVAFDLIQIQVVPLMKKSGMFDCCMPRKTIK